jgi:hypothetical protein
MEMYKRRTYKRRGRQVIGFYKDAKGKARPITWRKGIKRRRNSHTALTCWDSA